VAKLHRQLKSFRAAKRALASATWLTLALLRLELPVPLESPIWIS